MDAEVEERFTRVERVVGALADHVTHLDEVMATLAEAQIETVKRFNALSEETTRRFRETDERIRTLAEETSQRFKEAEARSKEMDARSREAEARLDGRIDRLVSAIGELIRRQPRAS